MCNTKFGEELRLHCFWVAACAASVISGFVAGWVWRDRPEALANVSILSVMTAVGTVGATVAAALGVIVPRLESRINATKRAQHVAASIYLDLGAMQGVLENICENWSYSDILTKQSLELLLGQIHGSILPIPEFDTVALDAIGENSGVRLAAALSAVRLACTRIQGVDDRWEKLPENRRQASLQGARRLFELALPDIREIGLKCNNAIIRAKNYHQDARK